MQKGDRRSDGPGQPSDIYTEGGYPMKKLVLKDTLGWGWWDPNEAVGLDIHPNKLFGSAHTSQLSSCAQAPTKTCTLLIAIKATVGQWLSHLPADRVVMY